MPRKHRRALRRSSLVPKLDYTPPVMAAMHGLRRVIVLPDTTVDSAVSDTLVDQPTADSTAGWPSLTSR